MSHIAKIKIRVDGTKGQWNSTRQLIIANITELNKSYELTG